MRKIKFRGLFGNEWKYGAYQKIGDVEQILIQEEGEFATVCTVGYIIKKGTLCQYTGLVDKNGVDIYDGDGIKLHKDYRVANNKIMQEGIVKWCDDGYWCVVSEYNINDYNRNNLPISNFPLDSFEVIGNIHEENKDV